MNLTAAFKEIFIFFFKQDLKSKRVKIFLLFSMVPVFILLIAKILEMNNPAADVLASKIFTRVVLIVYIQLLIPVLALLFGSLIVNEEVDNKTLVFLTTSPIPKPAVILGKYTAYVIITALIVNLGLFLSFFIVKIGNPGDTVHIKQFFSYVGVGTLALVTYTAFFTLLGTLFKKSMILGLLFIFGWENVVQYFPGTTQKFTIIHWIKSLLPAASDSGSFLRFLVFRLEPSSTAESLAVLAVFITAALIAASYIFRNKEYILSDSV